MHVEYVIVYSQCTFCLIIINQLIILWSTIEIFMSQKFEPLEVNVIVSVKLNRVRLNLFELYILYQMGNLISLFVCW